MKKDKFGNKVFEDYRPSFGSLITDYIELEEFKKSDEMNSIKVPLVIFPNDFKPDQTSQNSLQR